jgi:hypothetical protein
MVDNFTFGLHINASHIGQSLTADGATIALDFWLLSQAIGRQEIHLALTHARWHATRQVIVVDIQFP